MVKEAPAIEDRLAIRARPEGSPIMYQTWDRLLFMHWPMPVELLRPKIPARLEIDTCNDTAWVGVTPFTMWNVRPVAVPPIPGLDSFHELNVRTYVHRNGVPGVWFFSLDVNKTIPALAARAFYGLNYLRANIELTQTGRTIHYTLRRPAGDTTKAASFEASWEVGDMLPPSSPDTLEFFLTERYCLYAQSGSRLLRARVFHVPWDLRSARLLSFRSTMLGSHGFPEPDTPPLLHFAEPVDVGIWLPQEV